MDYRARGLNTKAHQLVADNGLGHIANLGIAGLVTTIAEKREAHSNDDSYTVIHGSQIAKTGTSVEIISTLAPIEFIDYRSGHYARGAKLTDGITMPLVAPSEGQIDLGTGNNRRKPKAPIASKDVNGSKPTYQNHGIQCDPWVNRDALRALIADQSTPDHLKAQAVEVISSCESDGRRFTQYVESRSGRLYPLHAVPMSREIRRTSFDYGFEVDIRNAHFTFMGSRARQLGIKTPLLNAYAEAPDALREEIAELLGVDPATAKLVMLMLIYGAPLDDRNSIAKTVENAGGNKELIRDCQPLKQLNSEIKKTGKTLIDSRPLSRDKRFLLNDLGKGIPLSATKAQKLAHINQGTEAMVARAGAEGEQIISWEHDGWTQEGEPDLEQMADKARKETGLAVEFTVKGEEDDYDLNAFLRDINQSSCRTK